MDHDSNNDAAVAEHALGCGRVRPSEQFDAMIHIDNTRALEPQDVTSEWIAGEAPETYPTGL
jgi:hypothetical protein